MALKALMLRKKIDLKKREMEKLLAQNEEIKKREQELVASVDEVTNEEEQAAVEEQAAQIETETAQVNGEIEQLQTVIDGLENELAQEEAEQKAPAAAEPAPAANERKGEMTMVKRDFFGMNMQERSAFIEREDVKKFLNDTRECIKERRTINGVGLTIPQVMLGLLRENIIRYSKLYKHVTVKQIGGEGRQLIMGTVPEAVWTECCANLNELDLSFFDLTLDCYKVGGYYAVCNANLEDSDLDLAAEILEALGQSIGKALDYAILFGRADAQHMMMPLGIMSRLVQESEPTGYPATARPWVDLHTTNVIEVSGSGATLIGNIVRATAAMKGEYSRGEKVWVMNEATYAALMAATVSVDANGRIVTGVVDTMPVVGGVIEVLSIVPSGFIVGGYFDLYTLGERAGAQFATSEHVRFINDQTVFRGTARYDGAPAIPEAFISILIPDGSSN